MPSKRTLKTERRRRRWQAFKRRRRLLTFEDVPRAERPHVATVAIPVVLILQSVEGWPRLTGIGLEAERSQLMSCVCLSLFDIVSGRFFGGTWSSSNVELNDDCVIQQIAYLSTYIDDPACVAVVELVVCCVDPKSGACKAQYGCGWGLIRLFGDNADTRIDWRDDEYSSATTIDFFDGTPRRLVAAVSTLELKRGIEPPAPRALAEAAGCGVITKCRLHYRLRRHDGLARVAHLIADDEFVSASELVPGLAPASPGVPKLGGDTADGPCLKPKPASTLTLVLEGIRVKIKNRAKFEDVLLRYVGFRSSIVDGNSHASKKPARTATKRDKIVARRVAIGIHNGRALTLRRKPDSMDGWKRIDFARSDGDVLAVAEGVRVEVPGYVRHPLVALVVALEYEVRPEQPVTNNYETIRVTLGMQAYVPFDGTRLRLRTGREERYVELQLETSERDLSPSNFVFPPNDSRLPSSHSEFYNLEAKFGTGSLIGFEVSARGKDGEEYTDQTPSRDSDQSSDDDDNVREVDDANIADSSEPSIASSSFAFEAPLPRRHLRVRPVDDCSFVSSAIPHVEESDDDMRQNRDVRRRQRPSFETAAEEAHRLWRSAAPKSSSLLARTLFAPLHRDVGDTMPPRVTASMARIARVTARPSDLTRADQARLSRLGVRVYDSAPASTKHDLRLELSDPLQRNEITIQFAAVRGLVTRALYFTYQFYTLPPTRSEVLRLASRETFTKKKTAEAVPLVRDHGSGITFAHDEPGLALKYIVDTTTSKPREAELFADYLATRTLHIDVWDADSRMSLGSLAIQLDRLLRQRAPVAKCAAEYAIVPVQGSVEDSDSTVVVESYVQIIMCNYGEKGQNLQTSAEEIKQDNEEETLDDWRRGNFETKLFCPGSADEQLQISYGRPRTAPHTRKKRPKHRVRAKPLTESMEVKTLMPSRNRNLQTADSKKNTMRVAKSSNAVTYDEVMSIVRRFRDNRGRVVYAGPLLALLEAPNIKAIEDKLLRVLTKAEARGMPLERIFGYLDADHGGTVSVTELEDSLRALGCFRGTSSAAVSALLRKFDTDGDGVISLPEFIDFVRQRQQPSKRIKKSELLSNSKAPPFSQALEARVRAMLYQAEEMGASVVDAFREFDTDSSGGLSESEFIGALVNLTDKGMSAADARALFCHIDKDSNGIVELNEFLDFVGRDYTDHLVLKLKTMLAAVEKKGTRIADVFAAWDTDNSGLLTTSEVAAGLTTLVQPELSQADVIKLLDRVDADKSGEVDIKELYAFVGWDYAEYVEARLRKILLVAARDFSVPLDAAFREWDKDSSGTISVAEFKGGLQSMRAWKLADDDVAVLARRVDTDGSGQVSLKEFLGFVGIDYVAVLAERLRSVLLKAEAKGTSLDVVFAQWDRDESGKISIVEFQKGLKALGGTFTFMANDKHSQPGITAADVEALAAMLSTCENEVRLTDLYAFMGRDPAAVLEAKLRRVVHSAGISAAEAFKHFDKNGDGKITLAELAAGLRELPGFEDVSDAQAQSLAKWYDLNAVGVISLVEFERQVGTQETAEAEGRLVASLRQAVNEPPATGFAGLERALTKRAKVKTDTFEDVMEGACREVGVTDKSVSRNELELVLTRLGSNFSVVLAFCRRRGVGTPAEIAKWRDEPSVVPERSGLAREAESSSVLIKFGYLLTTFEDTTRQDLAVAFKNLDKDSSGTVTASELYDGLRRLEGNIFADITRAEAERLVWAIDTDNSGSVELAELRAFARRHRGEAKPESRRGRRVYEIAESLRAVIRKAEIVGASTREIFNFFDINKNGVVSRYELGRQLEEFRGLFQAVTRAELDALIAQEFDKNGDGQVDVNEFVAFVRRKPTAALVKQKESGDVGESSAAIREKLRAILLRTEELGTPLRSAFRALDVNGDGCIEMRELQRGLAKMGVFDEALDEGTIESLIRDCFDKTGDGMVDVEEFLAFALGNADRGANQIRHDAEDAKEEDEDLCLVAKDYKFSLDPDTRSVEKKLRRAARELAAQGGDPRLLFHQYDPEATGSIIRSDFVQVLMQLGLSLLDPPMSRNAPESLEEPVRRRQMMQLARLRRHQGRPLYRDPHHEKASLMEDLDELAFVKWYRDSLKRDMVRSLLVKSMVKSVDVYPTFGQTLWFEHELQNPLNRAERVAVMVEDNEAMVSTLIKLRLVVSAEEWDYFRRRGHSPAHGSAGKGPIEADMIDASGPTPCVMLMANETVRLPFALLSLEPPGHDLRFTVMRKNKNGDKQHPRSVTTVKFVSASGFVLAALRVNAYPRHCIVDKTLRFYQAEGEIIKRTIHVSTPPRPEHPQRHVASDFLETALAAPTVTAQQKPMPFQGASRHEDDRMYVHCVTPPGAEIEVSLQWKQADGGGYEILIRCSRTPTFPSVAEFYVLIFRDRFCAALASVWHCVIHSRLRADANGLAGQAVGCSLVVRGDRSPRVVKAYAGECTSSTCNNTSFDPPQAFRLVPNAHNKFAVAVRPEAPGTRRYHVHLVDCDTHELVAAWILTVVAANPQVTKTYDVDLQLDAPCTKRIPYWNPWNKSRRFRLVSSDQSLVRPRNSDDAVHFAPNGHNYLRLTFGPMRQPGLQLAYLYLNDAETDQSEEVFLLRLLIANRNAL